MDAVFDLHFRASATNRIMSVFTNIGIASTEIHARPTATSPSTLVSLLLFCQRPQLTRRRKRRLQRFSTQRNPCMCKYRHHGQRLQLGLWLRHERQSNMVDCGTPPLHDSARCIYSHGMACPGRCTRCCVFSCGVRICDCRHLDLGKRSQCRECRGARLNNFEHEWVVLCY